MSFLYTSVSYCQINYFEDFNGCNSTSCHNWTVSGGFSPNITSIHNNGFTPCTNSSVRSNIYNTEPNTSLTSGVLGISNGFNAAISFNYKCINWSTGNSTPANSVNIIVEWSSNGSTWNTIGNFENVSSSSCISSPVFNFTPPAGNNIRIRIRSNRLLGDFWIVIDDISLIQIMPLTPTLLNISADPNLSTSFAHRKSSSATPKFTISSSSNFNAVQFELNHFSLFNGTAIVSTIIDGNSYMASTPYDFWTTQQLTGPRTYFVRVRLSDDGGLTWGNWTTQLWPYSYYPNTVYQEEGWFFTTEEQFALGQVQEQSYNFYNIVQPSNTLPDNDYFEIGEGVFSVNAGVGDGVREGSSWFPNSNFMTMGRRTSGCTQTGNFWNGMPFQLPIPRNALINSADFSVVVNDDCPCRNQTATLHMIFDAHAVDNAPALTSTNVAQTTGRTTANQVFSYSTSWFGSSGVRFVLTPVDNIVQEIVNRPGWNQNNMMNLLARWNSAHSPSGTHNRCMSQANHSDAQAPRLDGTFTNFFNTVRFPAVHRSLYGNSANWDELKIEDNTTSCGTCYVEYSIHDANNHSLLAGPFLRQSGLSGTASFDISFVSQAEIYVSARVFRNGSPSIHSLWLTTSDLSPLPVEWKTIHGDCFERYNEITWETASEENNHFFELERSKDGQNWEVICTVNGSGSTPFGNSYNCIDDNRQQLTYYRIKQNDFDGTINYSQILSIYCDSRNDFKVFPNPNNGVFTLQGGTETMIVKLIDQVGRVIHKNHIDKASTLFDFRGLSSGIYLLKIEENQIPIETLRIMIE
ncbi:MAG: T9SS type A sorting domain-containing protein [Crocinitomicaceae bacterium]|nr:T9SS type A sorting domain-containing protein [Crocinitomicaceae bacterium]